MTKPLALPVGSVRALLLLALSVTAVFELRRTDEVAEWRAAALLVSAAAYFASRHSPWRAPVPVGAVASRPPLGLPAGTVRVLFLVLAAYGGWLWSKHHGVTADHQPTVLVVVAFWIGFMVQFFMSQVRRPEDPSTLFFDHLQATASLLCAGGLVWLEIQGPPAGELSPWTQPAFAAVCTYYAGVR